MSHRLPKISAHPIDVTTINVEIPLTERIERNIPVNYENDPAISDAQKAQCNLAREGYMFTKTIEGSERGGKDTSDLWAIPCPSFGGSVPQGRLHCGRSRCLGRALVHRRLDGAHDADLNIRTNSLSTCDAGISMGEITLRCGSLS